jgi:carbohydrate kinase (thermoresistant glucokinase family)
MASQPIVSIVVMGVQGVGKTTIGTLLAARLGVPFIDGDRLHPARNVELMASGHPLSDEDREPWLRRVGETLAAHRATGGLVIVCSALRRRYRDTLRGFDPEAFFVEPYGPIELVARRIGGRTHEYMPPALLQSQYDTLEPLADDERGMRVSVEPTPEVIVEQVLERYLATAGERA